MGIEFVAVHFTDVKNLTAAITLPRMDNEVAKNQIIKGSIFIVSASKRSASSNDCPCPRVIQHLNKQSGC